MTNESSTPGEVRSSDQLGQEPKRYEGGRIKGGCSLHSDEMPGRCQPYHHRCPEPRVVDCCGVVDEHDIIECPQCGKQWTVPCRFDEDYS